MNEFGKSFIGIADTVLRRDAEIMQNSNVVKDDKDENFFLQASIETSFDGSPEVAVTASCRRSTDNERSYWGQMIFSSDNNNRTIESVDKIERYIELEDFANGGGVIAWEWAADETTHTRDFLHELLSLPQRMNCYGTDSFQIPKEIIVGV
mmetsp:Transcript_7094/g.10155  ORF Transcript_7094/g.10155 Transcript_7094/m.10155 type:complete len:151 (-) Transcript_7094:22-474(-)